MWIHLQLSRPEVASRYRVVERIVHIEDAELTTPHALQLSGRIVVEVTHMCTSQYSQEERDEEMENLEVRANSLETGPIWLTWTDAHDQARDTDVSPMVSASGESLYRQEDLLVFGHRSPGRKVTPGPCFRGERGKEV